MPVLCAVVIRGGKKPFETLEISSMALASAGVPVVFTATLCAFTIIVKLMIVVTRIILRIVANKKTLFINNYFMNQKYQSASVIGLKYYSKVITDYSAEKISEMKINQ
jgi:hypothetical protein